MSEMTYSIGRNRYDARPVNFTAPSFRDMARHVLSLSAEDKARAGYLAASFDDDLRADDVVVFNAFELLHVARAQARALAESGYRPPLPARRIPAFGSTVPRPCRRRFRA